MICDYDSNLIICNLLFTVFSTLLEKNVYVNYSNMTHLIIPIMHTLHTKVKESTPIILLLTVNYKVVFLPNLNVCCNFIICYVLNLNRIESAMASVAVMRPPDSPIIDGGRPLSTPVSHVSPLRRRRGVLDNSSSTRKSPSVGGASSAMLEINDDEAEKRARRRSKMLEMQQRNLVSPATPSERYVFGTIVTVLSISGFSM